MIGTQYDYIQQMIDRRARYETCTHCGQVIYPQTVPSGKKETWRHLSTKTVRCSGISTNQARCVQCSFGLPGHDTMAAPVRHECSSSRPCGACDDCCVSPGYDTHDFMP
jgi:hypothetical protein